ncbi:class II DAHP synthetase [Trichophyton violaceum]|uniref:Phospho-2-dehydro-3-deoxyheptonate aldolase n=1 Tax=Trichophyton violaceum TaxID=34388 RepID=A0A178FF52_TRIVO|nr:class II DAHP synthetase [Trichophyton violaceum]
MIASTQKSAIMFGNTAAKEKVMVHSPRSNDSWSPTSWTTKNTIIQEVQYKDPKVLQDVCNTIANLPPLITPEEIEAARSQFAEAALGKSFVLQGGDCAESFHDVRPHIVNQKIRLLEEQSHILSQGLNRPVATVGRIAGHNVNGPELSERQPDPHRLLLGYFHSQATLNLMRGPDALSTPPMGLFPSTPAGGEEGVTKRANGGTIYTSHEALHLPLESSSTDGRYNTSASFIWIGERTRQLDGGHVEYVRGLRNPMGIKVGPTMTGETLVELLNCICPNAQDQDHIGRITIITRFGADKVETVLPPLIQAVHKSGHRPLWMCDPCHGNTCTASSGHKTRHISSILREATTYYRVHRENGSTLGGLHLEKTGEFVTECVDGSDMGSEEKLGTNYRSLCDPRLSYLQGLTVVRGFVDFAQHIDAKYQAAAGNSI